MQKTILCGLLLLLFFSSTAQVASVPMNDQWERNFLLQAWAKDTLIVSGIQPFFTNGNTAWSVAIGDSASHGKRRSLVARKLFFESLVDVRGEDYRFTIDPLFEGSFGVDSNDSTAYSDTTRIFTNTRGFLVRGSIGDQIAVVSGFHETQSFFPLYLRNQIQSIGAVPGLGRFKAFRNANGFDYSMSFGELTYRPWTRLTMRLGYGKNFIGHGYRSHVLSDASFNYPFLAAHMRFGKNKWSYTTLYASLQSLERLPRGEVPESLFRRKGASLHLLTFSPTPRLEIGLFERIIWQRWDTSGTLHIPVGAFMPLAFLHSALNGLTSRHPSAIGAQVAVRVLRNWQCYAQWSSTGISEKRHAWQAGARLMDVWKGLDLRIEYNSVAAFFDNHQPSLQSATHFNQPLGSPVGGDSRELIAQADWLFRRWRASLKYNNIRRNLGPGAEWDSDPTVWALMDLVERVQRVQQLDASIGYVIHPSTNAQLIVGHTMRRVDAAGTGASFTYITLRTILNRRYFDF